MTTAITGVMDAATRGTTHLRKELAASLEANKDLREKLKARDMMESVRANMARDQSARAMFAEADKERLQAEVDRLTEENADLRRRYDHALEFLRNYNLLTQEQRDEFIRKVCSEAA